MSYDFDFAAVTTALQDVGNPVETIQHASIKDVAGYRDYNGVETEIRSALLDNLDATLRLTFPAMVGDTIIIGGGAAGMATGGADQDALLQFMADIETSLDAGVDPNSFNGVDMLAAQGAVDFSNTAFLNIYLPQGYSLGGEDPLLQNIVHTSAVPIPAVGWLMAGVIASLFSRRSPRSSY